MNLHSHHSMDEKIIFCEQLGEDLDAELCAEVAQHLAGCPDCRAHYNSVEQTVELYRATCEESDLPRGARERLFKVLQIRPGAN